MAIGMALTPRPRAGIRSPSRRKTGAAHKHHPLSLLGRYHPNLDAADFVEGLLLEGAMSVVSTARATAARRSGPQTWRSISCRAGRGMAAR